MKVLHPGNSEKNIFNNTIHDLENTSSTLSDHVMVTGIWFRGPSAASTSNIYNNFIHSLRNNPANTSTSSTIHGIEIDNTGGTAGTAVVRNVYNNVVSLGTDVASTPNIYGIYELNSAARTNNFYFNSVYIGGTASGHANNVGNITCFYIAGSGVGTVKDIRNNIMMNARTATGASEDFFCMHLAGNLDATTIDYNNYWFTGTGGALARMGTPTTGNFTTLAAWQADLITRVGVSGKDANSFNQNPQFISTSDLHIQACQGLAGTPIALVTEDIDGDTRIVPIIGADEVEVAPEAPGVITGVIQPCAEVENQPYSIEPVVGATSYNWTLPLGWSIASGSGTNAITVNTGTTGQHGTIQVTAFNGCLSEPQTLAVTLPAANANLSGDGDTRTCLVNKNGWIHFYDMDGDLIASVNALGQNLGNVSATSFVAGAPYITQACDDPTNPNLFQTKLQRTFRIEPENQPSVPVLVRLYTLNTEVQAYQTAATNSTPQNELDNISGISELHLTKVSNGAGTGNPEDICSGGGVPLYILQDASGDINSLPFSGFSATSYLEFSISSFSEFFPMGSKSSSSDLPEHLTAFAITVSPNPSSDNFAVFIQTHENFRNTVVELVDMSGRVILTQTTDIIAGNTLLNFDVKNIHSGAYFIRIKADNEKFTPIRVVKM